MESVTVITVTRGRPHLLKRAISSVKAQKCEANIYHTILIDDCEETKSILGALSLPSHISWEWMPRTSQERSGLSRVAKLRNYGIRAAKTKWIAFLDDDNVWAENHLATLLACAIQNKVRAAHSYMYIFSHDGTPFLEPRHPWTRDPQLRFEEYKRLVLKGVFTPGSHMVRDRADPLDTPDPARSVDMGEWLLSRELLLETPLREQYSALDEALMVGEDDKLMNDLIEKREPIACTYQPTFKYYLGGFSNGSSPD